MSEVGSSGSGGKLPVSVIIPCYQCVLTLRVAVESIMNQTVKPREIILIEDCSDDEGATLNLLHTIQLELEDLIRVVVITLPENRGAGEARNAGWLKATQEFIAFLDADDAWHHEKLEIQIVWMLAHPDYVLTCHNSKRLFSGGHLPPLKKAFREKSLYWRILLFKQEIATRTVVLRRDVSQRFPRGVRHAEDYQLWLRVLLGGGKSKRLCLPLAYSYKANFGAGGLSQDLSMMHKGVISCFGELLEDRVISRVIYLLAVSFETLKYWRRLVVRLARRLYAGLPKGAAK